MGTPVIKYVPTDNRIGAPAFTASGTFATSANVLPPVAFGEEVHMRDVQTGTGNAGGAIAVFCQGSNVVSAGQFVQIIGNSAVLLASGNSGSAYPIGIAGAPMSATNVWGWVGVQGVFDSGQFTNVAFTVPGSVYLPATAGQIASSAASNEYKEIRGIVLPNSFTSADSYLTVQLAWPSLLGRGATNAAW